MRASDSEVKTTDSIPPEYSYNKFQFGTLWQAYLPAMIYDLVSSSMYLGESATDTTQRNLLDVTSNLPQVVADTHPCHNSSAVITGTRWRGQAFFQLEYLTPQFLTNAVRICGLFYVTYIPGSEHEATGSLTHSAKKSFFIKWKFGLNGPFGINLTLSDLVAPSSYGCEDARVEIKRRFSTRMVFCPNWGSQNVLGVGITVQLLLSYNKHTHFTNHKSNKYITKISFHYQILDRDIWSLKHRYPGFQPAAQGEVYTLQVDTNNNIFQKLTDSSIGLMRFPNALVYIFSLMITNYLTPVVLRKDVTCNDNSAELIFYDGPPTLYMQPFLPILKLWSCNEASDNTQGKHDNEEVRSSLWILNFAVFVPTNDKNESFHLILTWQAKRILPSIYRLRTYKLGLLTNNTIHLIPRHSTACEVVHIVAPKGKFVRLWFSDIKYALVTHYPIYSLMCYTGIQIDDTTRMHLGFGIICSNSTAEHVVKHYKENGLTFGQSVVITLIQYWWIARVSAIIIVSTDYCSGYINLLPGKDIRPPTDSLSGAIVTFEATSEEWNVSYDTNVVMTIWFKRLPGKCVRLQLVNFRDLSASTARLNIHLPVIQYIITSEDLTSPARVLIDTSSIPNEVQLGNISSPYTLHLFSLEDTFTQPVELLHPGKWDTEAFVAHVRVHTILLTHVAGLTVLVEDGKSPPVCTVQHGESVAVFQALHLLGHCAYAELQLQEALTIRINKPYHNRHCCYLEGTIDHRQGNRRWVSLSFLGTQKSNASLPQEMYHIAGDFSDLNNKFNALCERFCMGIAFSIYTAHTDFTHRITVVYRASLIEHSYATYASSTHLGEWRQVCLKHACYILPLSPRITTSWNDAKEECEKKNHSLLSINSDSERTMLTLVSQETIEGSINLFEKIIYIGLKIKVSRYTLVK